MYLCVVPAGGPGCLQEVSPNLIFYDNSVGERRDECWGPNIGLLISLNSGHVRWIF